MARFVARRAFTLQFMERTPIVFNRGNNDLSEADAAVVSDHWLAKRLAASGDLQLIETDAERSARLAASKAEEAARKAAEAEEETQRLAAEEAARKAAEAEEETQRLAAEEAARKAADVQEQTPQLGGAPPRHGKPKK